MGNPSATDLALRAFEARPTRLEALADLARAAREAGQNEVAAMFARRGLAIRPTDDLLFVEKWAHESLQVDLSVAGYYSIDPETRAAAERMCDELALDRNVSRETRDLARHNLHFFLRPIAGVFPSWAAHRLTFEPPDGYRQMAPSIARHGDRILAAQRCINYGIDEGGYYQIDGHSRIGSGATIHTRTLLLEFDPASLIECVRGEITMPGFSPHSGALVQGFEDMRLISWRGELWGLSTVLDQNPDGRAEQWLARIGSDLAMHEARPICPEGPVQPREKNWMPFIDSEALRFIYWSDPTRIIDHEGRTVVESVPDIAADHLRGTSQAIPFAGGWLAIVHWVEWFDNWPKYRHRFAWYDAEYRLKKVSPGWVFSNKQPELDLLAGYEYCTGLCWHLDQRRLVLGFQIHEREAWVGTVAADDVVTALGMPSPLGVAAGSLPGAPAVAVGGGSVAARSNSTSNREIETSDSATPSRSPFDDERWVLTQTNRALQEWTAVERATQMLVSAGLPEHRDRIKNWDTAIALHHAYSSCPPDACVLDAGGDRNAAFLPGLAKLGYRRLLSINLEQAGTAREGEVSYSWGDVTRTGMADGMYRFVACLSVLEHGVNVPKFLDEMARIIAPGGYLFLSIDYWEIPVSTDHVTFVGSFAGQQWQIFTPSSVEALVTHARRAGFRMVGELDYHCRDRVAHHLGCDYTFLNLLFKR